MILVRRTDKIRIMVFRSEYRGFIIGDLFSKNRTGIFITGALCFYFAILQAVRVGDSINAILGPFQQFTAVIYPLNFVGNALTFCLEP